MKYMIKWNEETIGHLMPRVTYKDGDSCETINDTFVLVQNDKVVLAIPNRNVVIASTVSNDEYEAHVTSCKARELQQKAIDEKNIEENRKLAEQQKKVEQFDKFKHEAMNAFVLAIQKFKPE